MNFIFVSPNFPHTYWQFCDRLKRNGINVLGIGDAPYDSLEEPLKAALTEYYKVDSLENYDQVFRADVPRCGISGVQTRKDRLARIQYGILAGAGCQTQKRLQHRFRRAA